MFASFVVAAIESTPMTMEEASRIAPVLIQLRNGRNSLDNTGDAQIDDMIPASEDDGYDFYAGKSQTIVLAYYRAAICANDIRLTEIVSQREKL